MRSNKINKSRLLVSCMCDYINKSQEIKRYLCYQTLNPLSKIGKGYDGSKVNQPNIDYSLIERNDNRLIFNEMFNVGMNTEQKSFIFISDTDGNFDGVVGEIYIDINIVLPVGINELMELGTSRTHEIGQYIADLFDGVMVDEDDFADYLEYLGNMEFEYLDYRYGRVANKTDLVCLTMSFKVNKITYKG